MKWSQGFVVITIVAVGFATSCSRSKPVETPPPTVRAQSVAMTSLSQSQNAVGFQLFSKLLGENSRKNVVISPFSISEALLMAWAASDGAAHSSIANILALQGSNDNDIKIQNEALLEKQGITIGNSLWVKDIQDVSQSFLNEAKTYFHAEVEPLKSAAEINSWVSRVTSGAIKEIIASIDDLKCVIVNAIYFKELWAEPFDSSLTQISDFRRTPQDSIRRKFMNKGDRFSYFEDSGLQAVELPYQKNGHAMVVLLPPSTLQSADFPKLLEKNWTTWLKKFSLREGSLSLPSLKIEYGNDTLASILGVVGLPIAAVKGVISKIIHKTYIKVDEKGTEASAVTAVGIPEGIPTHQGPPPFVMKVNRPFFFAITNKETGSVLFLGFIADPVQE